MIGLLFLILGVCHYLLFRDNLFVFGVEIEGLKLLQDFIPQWFLWSFPSFAYTMAVCLTGMKFFGSYSGNLSNLKNIPYFLSLCLLFEFLQLSNIRGLAGTFDVNDILAI